MKQKLPLLALWLDSADYTLISQWMKEGLLPNLQKVCNAGIQARLESFPHSLAEVMQSFAITGARPEVSQYWGIHHYNPLTYQVTNQGIYNYKHRPPYFSLGKEYRVAVLDYPQFNFHDEIHGWQVRNWGTHSAMTPTDSRPPELIGALDQEFGVSPIRIHNCSTLQDAEDMRRLIEDLHQSIDQRTRMIETLLARESWDLFLVNFAELHKAGHYLVPNPDSIHVLGEKDPWAPLRQLHEHLDRSLGKILERFKDSHQIALFSYEGVQDYSDEVQNTFLLSDLLLRDSFGGQGAFIYDDPDRGLSPESEAGVKNWVMECWHLRRRPHAWQKLTEKYLGRSLATAMDRFFGLPPYPDHPATVPHCQYQPLMWLEKYRPYMRAFALPTFSDGFIRLNVRKREGHGLIAAADFRQECARLTALLHDLRNPVNNQAAVKNVIQVRDTPFQTGDEFPHADLIVQWNPLGDGGVFRSPTLGLFGPAPSLRASAHSAEGFFIANGPEITPVSETLSGSILDIAPTLLEMIGAQAPLPLEGNSLLCLHSRKCSL
jgi:predicted AlkP superfamily phosphohydrolase/phosphomutase